MGMFGLILALGAIAIAQLWHGGNLLTLLDGPAFVIVVGGTWGLSFCRRHASFYWKR